MKFELTFTRRKQLLIINLLICTIIIKRHTLLLFDYFYFEISDCCSNYVFNYEANAFLSIFNHFKGKQAINSYRHTSGKHIKSHVCCFFGMHIHIHLFYHVSIKRKGGRKGKQKMWMMVDNESRVVKGRTRFSSYGTSA